MLGDNVADSTKVLQGDSTWVTKASLSSSIDHGTMAGLADNDHPQYLLVADIDDAPVNGEVAQPISSNWAFDHVAAADPHTGYRLESVSIGSTDLATGAVTDPKLRQSTACAVIGRSANSAGEVADIEAAANGLVLRRTTNVLGFGSIDLSLSATVGSSILPIANGGTNQATNAFASYRTILDSTGSHTAARVAGTYGLGQGDPAAITGTGTLYPLNTINIVGADYPSIGGVASKLRIRVQTQCNDVAPTTTMVFGLHPITRPSTSGAAGVCIYTIGAAVSGSTVTQTTPAADSSTASVTADFALPSDGQYVLGFVQTGTMAASSHMHISMSLQIHNA